MIALKQLASALAVLSLFAGAPAFASDVSSDRHFAETKALQSRALQSLRTTTRLRALIHRGSRRRCLRLALHLCEER